jgi:hypothetical protein
MNPFLERYAQAAPAHGVENTLRPDGKLMNVLALGNC